MCKLNVFAEGEEEAHWLKQVGLNSLVSQFESELVMVRLLSDIGTSLLL